MTSTMLAVTRLVIILLLISAPAWAQPVLTIPPYLQNPTTTSICVRWTTDINSDSMLDYGAAPGNLTLQEYDATAETDHELCPSGLAVGTRYYYRVGATGVPLAGGDTDHFFETAPAVGSEGHVRLWFISDIHNANSSFISVKESYHNYTEGSPADLVLLGGDNAGTNGDTAETTTSLNSLSRISRSVPLFPAVGNHDSVDADTVNRTGAFFDLFTLPLPGAEGGYYSFNYANIHFIFLETTDVSIAIGSTQHDWLDADLAANTADWLIVVNHYPAYTRCLTDSDTDAGSIALRGNGGTHDTLSALQTNGLDLVLSGHQHCYERSSFVDGHYGVAATFVAATHIKQIGSGGCCGLYYSKVGGGPVANGGTVFLGLSSWSMIEGGVDTYDHPAIRVVRHATTGVVPGKQASAIIDIQGDLMDVHVLQQNGKIIDAWQIRKIDP